MAKKISTLSPEELQEIQNLQELYDLPSEIKQLDLVEILDAQDRVRQAREDLETLLSQLGTQLSLGMRVEAGELCIATGDDGRRRIAWTEREVDREVLDDTDIPF